jgi:HNH endonuclease
MSIQRQPVSECRGEEPAEGDDWVRVPAVIDANGDKVVTLRDEHGHAQTRLVAELVLEAFTGPQSPGNVVGFKDGNRLNCRRDNLEWVATPAARNEAARARAIATRARADAMRKTLEGRPHSDSALLVAEDRLR